MMLFLWVLSKDLIVVRFEDWIVAGKERSIQQKCPVSDRPAAMAIIGMINTSRCEAV